MDDSSPSEQSASSPVATTDDDHGQKIYPVTWRVIGGGVMMGGQSAYVLLAPTITTFIGVQGIYANASKEGAAQKATTVRTPTLMKVG